MFRPVAQRLRELYETIRGQRYAITQKERNPESAALACPMFGQGGALAGAISLAIPLYRFSQKVASLALPAVQMQAAALTRDWGGHWPFD